MKTLPIPPAGSPPRRRPGRRPVGSPLFLLVCACLGAAAVALAAPLSGCRGVSQEGGGGGAVATPSGGQQQQQKGAPDFGPGDVRRITEITDGDTFDLSGGETVRLIGIDTPEKYMSSKLRSDAKKTGKDVETIKALGRAATKEARRLAEGRPVALEYDQNNAAKGHEGSYGRTLAYVWVVEEESGSPRYMVNRQLVKRGYAKAYLKYPSERGEAFAALERQAREAARGLWAKGALSSK